MADPKDTRYIPDSRVDPRAEPPSARSKLDTPVEGSSKRPPLPPGAKVYQPHFSAKQTRQLEAPDAFAAIQDLRSDLKRRFESYEKGLRELTERTSELERGQGVVSHNDLSQAKELADALIRVKKLEEDLPKATGLAVEKANAKQTVDLKSNKLTEYLRLLGVVIGTAVASYFASYKGSSEAPKTPTIVNVQPQTQAPAAPAPSATGL